MLQVLRIDDDNDDGDKTICLPVHQQNRCMESYVPGLHVTSASEYLYSVIQSVSHEVLRGGRIRMRRILRKKWSAARMVYF